MSTILTTIRWLSIFTGALSLFFLGHAWFEFGLSEVIHRLHEWYVGLVHPVVELLKPLAQWLVGLLGLSLPQWWKDAAVLYFAMGGATARGNDSWFGWPHDGDGKPQYDKPLTWSARPTAGIWIPFRFVFWPLVWVYAVLWAAFERASAAKGERVPVYLLMLRGYIGTSVLEFAKILTGALMFAAINAGLG